MIGSVTFFGGFAILQYGRACATGVDCSCSKIIAALLVPVCLIRAFNLGAVLIRIGVMFFGLIGRTRQVRSRNAVSPDQLFRPDAQT